MCSPKYRHWSDLISCSCDTDGEWLLGARQWPWGSEVPSSVAWGDFEKQYPEMRGKKKNPHCKCASLKSVSLSVDLPRIKISLSLDGKIYAGYLDVHFWIMYVWNGSSFSNVSNIKTHTVNNACVYIFLPKHIWFLCICLSWNCQDFVKISF